MKTTIDAKALRDALALVKAPTATKRNYIPALSAVRIEAQDGALTLRTTDLETFAETSAPADVHADGVALVPFKVLAAACKGKGDAVLTVEGSRITVAVGPVATTIDCVAVEDFPKWVDATFDHVVTIATSDLAYVLKAHAAEEMRPALHGVNVSDGAITATNSYRLHSVVSSAHGFGDNGRTYAPQMFASAIKAAGALGALDLELGEKWGRIRVDSTFYIGRAVDAQFPNWRSLVPKHAAPRTLTVNVAELVAVLAAFPRTGNGSVSLTRQGDTLALHHKAGADAAISASFERVDDGEFLVAFAPDYLTDLVSYGSERVRLEGVDHLKPWLLHPDTLTGLLMPVRTEGH